MNQARGREKPPLLRSDWGGDGARRTALAEPARVLQFMMDLQRKRFSLLRISLWTILVLAILFIAPLGARALWWMNQDGAAQSWSRADWSSAGILPPPEEASEALIRVYAARTGRWRGIVAHHSWIVVKEEGAARYSRFDKVGWGSPIRTDGWSPDGRWFSHPPETIVAIDGEAAAHLIPRIRAAVAAYPWRGRRDYRAWPGPNSNTFVAHVLAEVPELRAALPPTALGKDWTAQGLHFGPTISGTGLRLSFGGYAGLAVGWIEGLELNILGLVAGIDLRHAGIKLPGWGNLRLIPPADAGARLSQPVASKTETARELSPRAENSIAR